MAVRTNSSAPDGSVLVPGGGDGLLLSMRRLDDLVAFSLQYEFEDVIADVTGADRVEAGDRARLDRSRRGYRLLRLATGSRRLARSAAPRPATVHLERDYTLFFPVFNHVHELFALATVPAWRRRSRVAACFINEVWADGLPRYLVELLRDFDHVFLGTRGAVESVASVIGRPCSYLPLAADVLRFSPYPDVPERTIDVCNIGRRSAATHQALLRLAATKHLFYYYDTVAASGAGRKQRTFRVDDPAEHRLLLASILRRSRYFIANRSRANEPELDRGEISSRFYEGAAAGTVMLGDPPRSAEFERQFDWPDAVIGVPFDAPGIDELLRDLDDDPVRLARVRGENVRNAALRHDWVHRLRTVFDTLEIPPTPRMIEREGRLRALADLASSPAIATTSRA